MVSDDPSVDGFGHHNPHLTQDDDLFYNALAIDRVIEGSFRGRDLSANEDTGGKGPNNQWAHAEYIENPVNK